MQGRSSWTLSICSDLAGKAVGVPVAADAHVVGVEGEDGLQAGGGAGGGANLHTQPFTIREYSMIYRGSGFLAFSLPRKLDRRHTGRLRKERQLADGRSGKGVGEEPKHTTARKPGPLLIIQYPMIFILNNWKSKDKYISKWRSHDKFF